MKRIILLFLLLSLMLTGCATTVPDSGADTTPGDTTTSGAVTDDVTTPAPAPSGIDLSGYTIVRSDDASELVTAISVKLFSDIKALGGSEISVAEDFLKDADPASEEVKTRPEILVGDTNRPESKLEKELGFAEVVIRQVGNKIVVQAGCEAVLELICRDFVNKLRVEDGKTYLTLSESDYLNVYDCTDSVGMYMVADQKNSKVSIYNLKMSDMSATDPPYSFEFERYNIAGLKLRVNQRTGGVVLLAAYGSRFAKMLDVKTGEVLWYCDSVGANPHSIELTPNGVIAVASSTGAVLNFYNETDASKVLSIPFPDAHGVLYDPDTRLVYAIGENRLRAFSVKLDEGGMPVAEENTEAAFTLPTNWAHDLQPVYGNHDRFWITTTSAVYQYSVSEKKIIDDYDGKKSVNVKNVKGIGNFTDGGIMYVVPDGKFESWTSESVYYLHEFNGKYFKYKISDAATGIYKLRVCDPAYQ